MGIYNENYNGVAYVGSVKWSNDNKHQMLFTNEQGVRSAQARHDFLISHLTKIAGNIISVTTPNGYIDLDCTIADIEKVNYCYYKNDSEFSNTYYCCFVTNYEILANGTTRLFLQWDYFQQFFYATTIFQCFIERAIIPKSQDSPNYNTLPEPISATLQFEYNKANVFTSADWEPSWVLHSASHYNESNGKYNYSGVSDSFGEYSIPIKSRSDLEDILKQYGRQGLKETIEKVISNLQNSPDTDFSGKDAIISAFTALLGGTIGTAIEAKDMIETAVNGLSIAQFQDHRDELIGLYAIPKWLADLTTLNIYTNQRLSRSVNISLNNQTLANGYTPRNKKMLSSVCRGYVLANKNGLKIPLNPELFTGNTTTLTLTGIPTSTSGFQYYFSNYADYQKSYGEIAYSSERRVGYDANTGINKAINLINAGSQAVSGAGSIAAGVGSANPVGVISGAGSVLGASMKAIDSIGAKEEHFGSNGDLLRITDGRAQLSFYEINPLYNECVAIDNFFDMYGYSINKHGTPNLYVRSVWNYIKTSDFNCTVEAPADAENAIKNIFNSGVTLWLSYEHFGDYSVANN